MQQGRQIVLGEQSPPEAFADYRACGAGVPVLASAIHAGHRMRGELLPYVALDDDTRLREEDPYTAAWTGCAPGHIVVRRSRFEVDVNRPRDRAVYLAPEDAWGLDVWRTPLPDAMVGTSLQEYDDFYAAVAAVLDECVSLHGGFVLLDLHSYNHRRGGPDAAPDDPAENPEVNLGTGTMDRARWEPVIDAFVSTFAEEGVDIRENVKFRGGQLAAWVHGRYPTGCVLAVEFKKTWMDEWSGVRDDRAHARIASLLADAVPRVARGLEAVLP